MKVPVELTDFWDLILGDQTERLRKRTFRRTQYTTFSSDPGTIGFY